MLKIFMNMRVVSVFCSAGGMDFGSHAAGLKTVLTLDKFARSTETLARHFQNTNVVTSDIYKFRACKKTPYPAAKVLTGGKICKIEVQFFDNTTLRKLFVNVTRNRKSVECALSVALSNE